jgi:arylformamidase
MTKIIDVTVPLSPDLARYPGDPPFDLSFTARMSDGAPFNASRLSLGTHYGTHVDAPFHFTPDGPTIDQVPLGILIGKARVAELTVVERIERPDLESLDLRDDLRLLLKTRMSGQIRGRAFHENHVHLTPDAARYLVQAGIKLLGIDYLSVDPYPLGAFPAHQELLMAGVVIVEGLDLSDVEPGEYELLCLPLPLTGGDAAPARVLLRTRL